MPFRIRSSTCNHMSDEPCTACDETRKRNIISLRPPAIHRFPEDFKNEHAFHPWELVVPVSSREELRQQCADRGVESHYLRDSSTWRSGRTRWI